MLEDPRRVDERTADDALLVLVREHDVGLRGCARCRGTPSTPLSRIALHEARSTLTRAPRGRARARRCAARRSAPARPSARSPRRAGDRSRRATAGSISSVRRSRAVPRSAAIERSPSGETSEQIEPSDPRSARRPRRRSAASLARTSSPASSAPVFPMKRARGAQLGRPRGDVRRLPARPDADLGVRIPPVGNRPGEPDDDVERQIAERADEHRDGIVRSGQWTAPSDVAGCAPSSSEGSSVRRRDRGAEPPTARSASPWATARSRGLRERAVLPRAPRAGAGGDKAAR